MELLFFCQQKIGEFMEVEKARGLGLCFGVRRAIRMLREAADKYGSIETLGPIAHNQQLVRGLAKAGIKPVEELEQVQGKIVAITTHGVSPAVLSEIEAHRIHIINTTCPIVRQAQDAARELAEAGFDVVIFGEAEHPEVKALLGWAEGRGIAALDVKQFVALSLLPRTEALSPSVPVILREQSDREISLRAKSAKGQRDDRHRLGIISQTTQSQSAFFQFVTQFTATFPCDTLSQSSECNQELTRQSVKGVRIVNTLCQTIQRRLKAAIELAQRSQLMIVVGGHDSANTKRLTEVCSPIVKTHLVEGVSEVDNSWLEGKQHIGITAGASTPDEAIEGVVAKLKSS